MRRGLLFALRSFNAAVCALCETNLLQLRRGLYHGVGRL